MGGQGSLDHIRCFHDRAIREWRGRLGEFSKSLEGRVDT